MRRDVGSVEAQEPQEPQPNPLTNPACSPQLHSTGIDEFHRDLTSEIRLRKRNANLLRDFFPAEVMADSGGSETS